MENITDGNAAVSSTAGDDYGFLNQDGSVAAGVIETPPVSTAVSEQDATAGNEKPVAEEPKPAETPTAEDTEVNQGLAQKTKRRIEKLLARVREHEEKQTTAEVEAERYKKAFALLQEQFNAKQSRLQELDPTDPVIAENERLKFEKQIAAAQQDLDKQYQTRIKEVQEQARVQSKLDRIFDDFESALSKFPTVSQAELAIAMKQAGNSDASIEDLARGIHEQRYKALESEFMSKYKDRLNPPKPTSPNGAATRRPLATDTELADELDAMLGADWDRRHA